MCCHLFTTWEYTLYVYICKYNIQTLYIHIIFVYPQVWDLNVLLVFWTNYYMLDQLRIIKEVFILFSVASPMLFLCADPCFWSMSFYSLWKMLLAFLTGKLLATNSFLFLCLKCTFLLHFKDNFWGTEFWVDIFFFFFFKSLYLNISLHFIFAFMVS